MKSPPDPDLELRGKLVRGLGSLREMLPGSFVERKRACGRPNCHCADGKNLHSQFQISVLVDGKPKALSTFPPSWWRRYGRKLRCPDALIPLLRPSAVPT